MLTTLKIVGWILAKTPIPALEIIARFLGNIACAYLPKRRYILESNLHHAFPEKPAEWRQSILRENSARLVEMGLLVLALPYLSKDQLRERVHIPNTQRKLYNSIKNSQRPTIILVPHFTLYEYLPMIPALMGWKEVNAAAIFRPLRNSKINEWIKKTRERFGVTLLSRKEGFNKAREVLKRKGILSILFDQNARRGGTLMNFFGRIASTTELPKILANHYAARVYIFHPKRIRFWMAELKLHEIEIGERPDCMNYANKWLEKKISSNDDVCADWLWMHNRWKILEHPQRRFSFSHKKQNIDLNDITSGFRLWVRLDLDASIAEESLPLISSIKEGRPDVEVTILLPSEICENAMIGNLRDRVIILPPEKIPNRLSAIRNLRYSYPDLLLLLTQSSHAEKEAKLIKAPQVFGLKYPSIRRVGLTHWYEGNQSAPLINSLYEMASHFGLNK